VLKKISTLKNDELIFGSFKFTNYNSLPSMLSRKSSVSAREFSFRGGIFFHIASRNISMVLLSTTQAGGAGTVKTMKNATKK